MGSCSLKYAGCVLNSSTITHSLGYLQMWWELEKLLKFLSVMLLHTASVQEDASLELLVHELFPFDMESLAWQALFQHFYLRVRKWFCLDPGPLLCLPSGGQIPQLT